MMKRLLVTSAIVLTAASGTSLSLKPTPLGADEKPPIVVQVENHEQRIGDLEVKTDETKTQVNQNTADIKVLQENTNTPPAPKVPPVHTPVAQPEPGQSTEEELPPQTPEPPTVDPYTIVSVEDTPGTHGHSCLYTLENGKTKNVNTGNATACFEVGTVLPQWLWPK